MVAKIKFDVVTNTSKVEISDITVEDLVVIRRELAGHYTNIDVTIDADGSVVAAVSSSFDELYDNLVRVKLIPAK